MHLVKSATSPIYRTLRTLTTSNSMAATLASAKDPLTGPRYEREPNVLRKKLASVVPGTVNLQILGSGANGAPSAVYLFTDQARYLFNCGEGTQRLAHEHKTRLSRLEQIFLTQNTWASCGGLPGLTLTIQDAGVRDLGLHGPPHLGPMLQSMRRFVVLKNLQVRPIDCSEGACFEDSILKVDSLPLISSEDQKKSVVNYICQLKPRAGALNLVKCVERGLKPGPLLGQLKNGQDVTLPDGTIVRSADVTEASETALSFVFLDVPTEDYLPGLLAHAKRLKSLGEEKLTQVALVIHFTPHQIASRQDYKDFLVENFSPGTEHIHLSSPLNQFSGYAAAHRIQHQLNQLAPQVFPLLGEQISCPSQSLSLNLKKTKLEETDADAKKDEKSSEEGEQGVVAMTSFHLRPRKGLDRTLESKLTPEEYIKETHAVPGFTELLAKYKEDYSFPVNSADSFPKIIFLGTGSCIPNKTRNVSSILIKTAVDAYVLLDCGEGTYGQIVRLYGIEQGQKILRQLQAIYVSHLHADHHIGLIGLLRERRQLEPKAGPLILLAPRQIEPWLEFYNREIETIDDAYTLVANAELLANPLTGDKVEPLGITAISSCLVRHCPNSFGISLTLAAKHEDEPVKITYSGDTMPCQDLVDLGRDSTVLIHEATMEDDLEEEARLKTHSTVSQAIQQGRNMDARHTILTHFSQRYAKCPRLPSDEDMQRVAIAFDNMEVTLEDLQHYHKLYPALLAMYAEYTEELEQRAVKRELKQERKRKLVQT
ncbi:ribonuclease Z, mitochondrial [Drosophila ficusphila]|uniref:ribonuclease Z, mitochondrial n=1 Tax=Drosophila ficusphila TaxID=30025 RepID=UPI0007E6B7D4|nr:ribonuclease Z, mitochondrial [Drosophila ficusphila]